ncbi:hypothetical protein BH09CHL1_BH09CHL1_29630 [soil metagenome]
MRTSKTPRKPISQDTDAPADVRSFFKSWLKAGSGQRAVFTRTDGEGFRERLAEGDVRAAAVMRPNFEFDTDDDVLNAVANRILGSFFDALQHLSQLSEDDLNALSLGNGGAELTELANIWCESLLDTWLTLLADLLHSAGEDPIRYLTQLKQDAGFGPT